MTLVSPLAPGADMALTEAMATALAGRAGQLRLIVPEAVPYRVVLDIAASEAAGDKARAVEAMLACRRALFARFGRVDIVRIGFAGVTDYSYRRDKTQFELGLARANAYMARRADMLGVLWDERPTRGPGGTGDLVAYWRNPAGIPAEIDPPPRRSVPNRPTARRACSSSRSRGAMSPTDPGFGPGKNSGFRALPSSAMISLIFWGWVLNDSDTAGGGRRPVRIEDVAREAGVSPITVSRALATPQKVKQETRERVLQAVEKTGYVVNSIASSLRSGRSSIVTVFVASLLNPHFASAVQGGHSMRLKAAAFT